ncbi:MAG TPA: PEGA domain-containing protein [Phycisphaerales bacterium]|nr:PEGA domain-containing protein [Phycisphaerales bacterium]
MSLPFNLARAVVAIALAGAALLSGGCLERTIKVTTEPEGAVVWINDVEVGRTPLETDFTYYGDFSVRIRKEGYEPVVDVKHVSAPVQELPVVDLAAEALPVKFENNVYWHWVLEPAIEARMSPTEAETRVVHDALQMRLQLQGIDASAQKPGAEPKPEPQPASEPESKETPQPESSPAASENK